MAKIATGDEAEAIRLGWFVSAYVPSNWIVPIKNVDHAPMFLAHDYARFKTAFETGRLDPEITDARWYVKDAIKAFFKQNK